jgi:hypothetical protein
MAVGCVARSRGVDGATMTEARIADVASDVWHVKEFFRSARTPPAVSSAAVDSFT